MIDPLQPDFTETPTSPRRPAFGYAPGKPDTDAPLCIVTPFHDPGARFRETVRAILGQSFQHWEWRIVNDASTDPASLALLDDLRTSDPRIRVIDHPRNRGVAAARNTGVASSRCPFVYLIDDDDLIEPTALEKLLWFLETHEEYAFADSWCVEFEAESVLRKTGFHRGEEFLTRNLVGGRALVRRRAFEAAGGFDESIREGFEDWDFWLRCAEAGLWGGTIPEYLTWHRRRADESKRWPSFGDPAGARAFREGLQRRHPGVFAGGFPQPAPQQASPYEPAADELPFENPLPAARPRLLLVLPWLTMGGADKFNLDVTRLLAAQGWEVSIATTLEGDQSWAPEFARHTPDIFLLGRFLRPADHPRFLRHLIRSRRPDVVLVSHSELGYLLLPYLRTHCPDPVYLDYTHMEVPEWKNGGYARYAAGMQEWLDRNLVSSEHLREWLAERGADPQRIDVVYTNVDGRQWSREPEARRRLRDEWGLEDDVPVILFAGRLCAQKQPGVLAGALRELARREAPFHAAIAGDGEDRAALLRSLRKAGLSDRVRFLGAVPNEGMRDLMSACDLFFLPSRFEGISLAFFEAMAMELPIVGADVGGQRELVTPECGVLLPRDSEEREILAYADALEDLLRDSGRRQAMGRRARERVIEAFALERLADRLVECFAGARRDESRAERRGLSPAQARECATQAVEFLRISDLADRLWRERHQQQDGPQPDLPGPSAGLRDEAELHYIESSRAWRAVRRLRDTGVYRTWARIQLGPDWDADETSESPSARLARIRASRAYRLIQAVKRTPPYRAYARRRYGLD